MLAASISNDVWIGTAVIAAVTVLSCLGFLCKRLGYELELIDVISSVKTLRDKMAHQLDQAGEEAADQPSRIQRNQARADSETPSPDADASRGMDDPADSEEVLVIQPDPEPGKPNSAEAA